MAYFKGQWIILELAKALSSFGRLSLHTKEGGKFVCVLVFEAGKNCILMMTTETEGYQYIL